VRKLISIGAGAVGVAGVMVALVGHGTAAALPDVSGQPYGKVKQALQGFNLVVATRVGDRMDEDKCTVDRIQPANFVNGTGAPASSTIYVYLNCYGNVATPNSPGYSQQDPMGKTVQSNNGG